MTNPFASLDEVTDTILGELLGDADISVEMEAPAGILRLLSNGWHAVKGNFWRHKDAPAGQCLSSYFAYKVQECMDAKGYDYERSLSAIWWEVYSD